MALSEQDRYPSYRSQLCGFYQASWPVVFGIVLLFSCRHIMTNLMRSQIMMWLARLARHTTFAPKHWSLLKGLDAIIRSRPFLEFRLIFLGNRDVINSIGIIWGPQRPALCHALARAGLFDFRINCCFSLRVTRLEGGCFNF